MKLFVTTKTHFLFITFSTTKMTAAHFSAQQLAALGYFDSFGNNFFHTHTQMSSYSSRKKGIAQGRLGASLWREEGGHASAAWTRRRDNLVFCGNVGFDEV